MHSVKVVYFKAAHTWRHSFNTVKISVLKVSVILIVLCAQQSGKGDPIICTTCKDGFAYSKTTYPVELLSKHTVNKVSKNFIRESGKVCCEHRQQHLRQTVITSNCSSKRVSEWCNNTHTHRGRSCLKSNRCIYWFRLQLLRVLS